ncbi:hypothetical protein, partial [Salmonella enterica]
MALCQLFSSSGFTYNAGSLWPNVLDAIKQQTIYPDKLIV